MVVSKSSFGMHSKIVPGLPRSPGHMIQSFSLTVHVSRMEATRNHMAQGPGCMVDASSLQCYGAQATLAQEQLHVAEHCLDEESPLNKFW